MARRPETHPLVDIDTNWLRRFRRNVRRWYERNARDLPWRRSRDPYAIWISEIMLQQTTVAAVVPYFERFLQRFPTVAELAQADEDEVLRMWEGLGYYSRARNIHRAARRIVAEHGGGFPEEAAGLRGLPGIGRYTAGAIASFAFDRRAPIVEANTLRLHSRLLGYRGDPRSNDGQRLLWQFAERVLPRKEPGRFNQALMELGSGMCTVNAPRCDRCPVRSCCRAFADGLQETIPGRASRPEITAVAEAAVAVRRKGAYRLHRRGEGERWAGLWDFGRFPLTEEISSSLSSVFGSNGSQKNGRRRPRRAVPPATGKAVQERVAAETGVTVSRLEPLTEIRHSVTRYRIRLFCFLAEYRDGPTGDDEGIRWLRPEQFGELPLSVAGRRLAGLLQERDDP